MVPAQPLDPTRPGWDRHGPRPASPTPQRAALRPHWGRHGPSGAEPPTGSQRSLLVARVLHAVLQLFALVFIALALLLTCSVWAQPCMVCGGRARCVRPDKGTRFHRVPVDTSPAGDRPLSAATPSGWQHRCSSAQHSLRPCHRVGLWGIAGVVMSHDPASFGGLVEPSALAYLARLALGIRRRGAPCAPRPARRRQRSVRPGAAAAAWP